MSSIAPQELIISGVVFHGNTPFASIGDVRLHPGANKTGYIDGYIFDGQKWRSLDLVSFGAASRNFGGTGEIGSVMRKIDSIVSGRKGTPVHYELAPSGKKSRYVFRGTFPSKFQASWY
ncbi:hypothetical protein [Pseudomonas sp. SW-3]|uniref:hypothetical protein n=1 Tax=Pseudomonas sp. SW-3 TaxID=147212 RepID=UPI0019097A7D|nr:hypothetical protein [Pseudomonas sp. SW-3]QQN99139.1 hypothetical protein JIO00_00880 [Pseudomonas sp. SW-3]